MQTMMDTSADIALQKHYKSWRKNTALCNAVFLIGNQPLAMPVERKKL